MAATEPEKFEPARRDTFTAEQVVLLIEAAKGTDWSGAILFSWTSGARLSDAANLRWSSIDTEHGVVVFRQRKTGREIVVGLHPDFEDWITTVTAAADRTKELVFPSSQGNRQMA